MPDWRNPEDYAYLEGYDLHHWAWEFLRRNPEYRAAYYAFAPYEDMETQGKLNTREKWQAFRELNEAASTPWGLKFPTDPELTYDEGYPCFEGLAGVSMPVKWDATPYRRAHLWPGYPHRVAIVFDFHKPIDIQIDIAAERLRRYARHIAETFKFEAPRVRPPKGLRVRQFPLYVRILDAELQGATIGEMGRELFGHRQQQRGNLKSVRATARRMASQGYRDLIALPPEGVL